MAVLTVKAVRGDTDMRKMHVYRDRTARMSLKHGEAALFLNRAMTIARLIDSEGGVHCYWAEDGKFDLAEIKRLVKAVRLELVVTPQKASSVKALAA